MPGFGYAPAPDPKNRAKEATGADGSTAEQVAPEQTAAEQTAVDPKSKKPIIADFLLDETQEAGDTPASELPGSQLSATTPIDPDPKASSASSPSNAAVHEMKVRPVPPATAKDKFKKWFGLAVVPQTRWELNDPGQIEADDKRLVIRKSPAGEIILQVTAGEIKGAMFYPVHGRAGAFDLMVDLEEPNRFIPRDSRAFYAGTFVNNAAFQPAYKFLRSHGLATSPLLEDIFPK